MSSLSADRPGAIPGSVRELSWSQFDALTLELARGLASVFTPDAVVGVARGGVFVGGAIASVLQRDFYPVRISRRSGPDVVRDAPKVFGALPRELKGLKVLVVDDVADTGETLKLAASLAEKAGAAEVRTAALVVRPGGFRPDWSATESDEPLSFPWDYGAAPRRPGEE
jgi:hypothetical protein